MLTTAVLVLALQAEGQGDPPRLELSAPADGFRLNVRTPSVRGMALYAREFVTDRLDADIPFAEEVRSDGFNPVLRTRLEISEVEFDAPVLAFAFDLDLFRLSVNVFRGEWEGEGTLTVDDGIRPATTQPVDVEGDVWGFKVALEWPLVEYRSGSVRASLGPEFGVLWVHEELEAIPASPIQFSDDFDQLVGSLGPKLRLGVGLGGFEILAEGLGAYLFDQLKGWSLEASLGVGFRF